MKRCVHSRLNLKSIFINHCLLSMQAIKDDTVKRKGCKKFFIMKFPFRNYNLLISSNSFQSFSRRKSSTK